MGARQHGAKEVLLGGVPEFLSKLEGRIGAIHLIDSDGTLHGDETSTHRPFGEGYIDFKSLAPQLLAVPNIEWWCIDMCFWAGSWELVESSREFVAESAGPEGSRADDAPQLPAAGRPRQAASRCVSYEPKSTLRVAEHPIAEGEVPRHRRPHAPVSG